MTDHKTLDSWDDELRAALRDEADSVTPGDGLTAIRQRTRRRGAVRKTRRWLPALAGAVVAAGVVGAVVLVAGDDDGPGTSPQPADTVEAQLWFADGRFVSPESVEVEDTGDEALDVVNGLLSQVPPENLENSWYCLGDSLGITANTVAVQAGTAEVSLATSPSSSSGACGETLPPVALQQLAYALHEVDTSVQSVVVTGFNETGASLDPYAKAPIIVDAPGAGATVTSPVQVSGESTAHEGTVNWIVNDDSGAKVDEGYYTGGSMGEYLPFSFAIDLEPGEYTITLMEYSMEDGSVFYDTSVPFTVE